jgi:hypothetical protein
MMTNQEIEIEIKHLATKEDLANLRAEMHKAFSDQLKWIIGLQLPSWLGIISILLSILLRK